MKKLFIALFLVFNTLVIAYLVSPTPTLKDIPNTVKSELPGDTTQIKNVSAYFGNLSRTEVINFYKANYHGPFRIQLNHPPEKAKEIIRDTTQSYYLEEIILPFKESIFINGYEWQNDVFTKPEKRYANKLLYNNIEYQTKITIKVFPTSIAQRLITFFILEAAIISIIFIYKSLIFNKQRA